MRPLLTGAAVLTAACVGSHGTRPLRPSLEEVMPASTAVVYQAAVKAVTDQGLPLREAEASTLVVQTNYVDLGQFDPRAASQYPSAERLVRFRVLVRPRSEGPGSVVAIFGIYAPFRTGFSTSERNERSVPGDHPAMALVRRIRDDIAKAVGQ